MQLVGLIYIMQPLHDEAERTKTEATTSANSSLLGGPDVYRAEMGNIREYTYPDVNLGDDTYKHFLYPTNEVASETNASPEDYNDDIDFNADLDDVLNQDESDSDRNSAGTSHDSVRCVNDLNYQQEVLECNKHQSNTMQKYNIEDTLVAVEDEGEDFKLTMQPTAKSCMQQQTSSSGSIDWSIQYYLHTRGDKLDDRRKKGLELRIGYNDKVHAQTVKKLDITVSLAKILHSEIEVL
ncbi:hypothetical protein MRB53_026926 [Persea americana]|uniref:Uncharacterized protein n=1 Tax=Persea americana TaxID=3435 RepID=A0ACC2LK00_PERAE|nr:hypothetical protein MRB53_026926 [Persea americana]